MGSQTRSVQWKGYCFKDEEDRQKWLKHSDDLSPELAWKTLLTEMERRGKLTWEEIEDVKTITSYFFYY